jgi:aryl carrier-like protein
VVRGAYAAPQGEIEQVIAQVWQELLGLERVGRHDHFFELGGNSLLAIQLIEQMRRRGYLLQVGDLFRAPELALLGQHVRHNEDDMAQLGIPENLIPVLAEPDQSSSSIEEMRL